MPALSQDTIYFILEYRIIDHATGTLCRLPSYSARWDADEPGQYTEPALDLISSPGHILIRYHIGNKIRYRSEGGFDFAEADVLTPCERYLQDAGYRIIR